MRHVIESAPPRARRIPGWGRLAIVAAVAVAVAAGVRAWIERQEAQATERWRSHLSAMAEDRGRAIEAWVRERLGNARTIAAYPTTLYLASGRRGPPYPFPSKQGARAHLADLLRSTRSFFGYEGAWLVGAGSEAPVLAAATAAPPDRPLVERVLQHGDAEIDVRRRDDRAWALIAAPVGAREGTHGRPIGAVVLAEDAGTSLFALLDNEPARTATGESLLVRREGAEVVFLSPLRRGPAGLRLPAGTEGLAAAAALHGREVFGSFKDYRGVAVLAAVRPVRGTAWGLVVKIDRDEALESARTDARQVLAAAGGVLLAVLGIGFGLWRHHAAAARVALAHSEARFGLVLEHAADAVLFVRPDGRIAKANRRAEELYGCPRAELESLRIHDLYPPEGVGSVEARMEAVRRESALVFETEHRARDGTALAVEVSSRYLEEEGLFFSIVRDVRERKAVIAALAESKAFLETLVDSASAAIFTLHPDGRVGDVWNPAAEWLFGWRRDEVVGRPAPLVPPERQDEFRALRQTILEGRSLTNVEVTRVRSDGTPIELSLAASPLRDEAGRVASILAVAIDVTERKRAEAALAASEERFKRLAENAPDVIYRHRLLPSARTEYVSPAVHALCGYSPEEFRSDPELLGRLIHPDDRHLAEEAVRGEIPSGKPVVVRWLRRDGTTLWTEVRNVVVRDDQGAAVALEGIARDVTERTAAEEALRRAQDQLLQSQKLEAVGRLAGGVAHDFNNLLGVIIGHAELAQRDAGPANALKARLEAVLGAARRAADLTRQLLAFSRRQVLQPRVVDLNAEVADLEKMLRRLIGEDVELVTRLDPALAPVRADPGQIGQVLMNLAVNAREAMPQGGVLTIETANVEVDRPFAEEHAPMVPGPYVRLVVADDGPGLDASVREHLFEPFVTTKPEGSGLGLSTVYGIVKQSGGYVWAEPGPGRGTTFTVHLPRWDGPADEIPAAVPARPGGGSETILVVEDQEELRGLICEVLQGAGYRVLQAADGRGALALSDASSEPIHLLVTDIVMPGMSGREMAEALCARRTETRTLLISGYPNEAIERSGGLGGFALLEKPFSRTRLLQQVRQTLQIGRS
jgi:two-component system cell cycle sensor histidine kinase/response regulator CckA